MIIFRQKFKTFLLALLALFLSLGPAWPSRQILADTAEPELSRLFYRVDKASWLDPSFLAVDLVLENRGEAINAWQMDILYSTDSLALYRASTSPEICPFSLAPVIDNEGGSFSYVCGNPDTLPATTTVLTHLTFRKLDTQAPAILSFGDGTKVLLADGLGTPLDLMTETHRIYLKNNQ